MTENYNSHWTNCWQSGALTSLPQDFKLNYDGELYDYWYEVVSSFKDSTVVLDICTGNGAVAILIEEISVRQNKNIKVIAVDAADINPTRVIQAHHESSEAINNIHFIGNCFIEQIDQKLGSAVDYIVSQYEYCDIDKIAPKLDTILNPGGKLIFISHSTETDIIKYMEVEESNYQKLLDFKVFDTFEKYERGAYSPDKFRNKIRQHIRQVKRYYGFKSDQLIDDWVDTMFAMSNMSIPIIQQQKKQIVNFCQQHKFARYRAIDLLAVTKKINNNPLWFMKFEQYGFELNQEGVIWYQGVHNAGQYYQFDKNKSDISLSV